MLQEAQLILNLKNPATRREAFTEMVKLYQKRTYSIIRRMVISHDDADDIIQDVFVKVWTHIDNFSGDAQIFTWIYRIAVNETLTFLRRQKRFSFFGRAETELLMNKLKAGTDLDGDSIQLKLQKAILRLPDRQRLVFNLMYFEDMSYEEIAAVTDTSVGSLKASYHHATKKIEEFLSED